MHRDLLEIINSFYSTYPQYKKQATDVENIVLVRRIKEGDEDAQTELLCRNASFISRALDKFYTGNLIEDIFMTCCEYIKVAALSFNENAGTSFTTYFYNYIKKAVTEATKSNCNGLRVPDHVKRILFKLIKDENMESRTFTAEEIVDRYKVSMDVAYALTALRLSPVSTSAPVTGDNNSHIEEFGNFISDPGIDIEGELGKKRLVESLMYIMKADLTEREYEIFMQYNGLLLVEGMGVLDVRNRTLKEISGDYNLSLEGVRKVARRVSEKLRKNPKIADAVAGFELLYA